MATTPIVTEVTLAELEALIAASGLNELLQYKVTDKDWLLTATSNNKLIPLNGILMLDFSKTNVPDFIDAEKVYLKSEDIVMAGHDIGVEEDVPVVINFDMKYHLNSVSITNNGLFGSGYQSEISLADEDKIQKLVFIINSSESETQIATARTHAAIYDNSQKQYLLYFTTDSSNNPISTSTFVIEFIKIPA